MSRSTKRPAKGEVKRILEGIWTQLDHERICRQMELYPWIVHEPVPAFFYGSEIPFIHGMIRAGFANAIEAAIELDVPLELRDAKGRTAIHALADASAGLSEDTRWSLIQRMISKGARCDVVDETGMPLWMACSGNTPSHWTKRFIEEGSPVDCILTGGESALGTLIARGLVHPQARATLDAVLAAGADVNLTSGFDIGKAPIAEALKWDNMDLAAELLERGADVHARDHLGRTLLHVPMGKQAIRWLVEQGLNVNLVDRRGLTPLLSVLHRCLKEPGSWIDACATGLLVEGAELGALDTYSVIRRTAAELIQEHKSKWPAVVAATQSMQTRRSVLDVISEIDDAAPRARP